jgi:hypothetical protein
MPFLSNGFKTSQVFKIRCENPLAIRLSLSATGRSGEVAAIGLPTTNHFSPITSLSDIAFATSDHGRASGLPVRFQDLFLAFSQDVDLGPLRKDFDHNSYLSSYSFEPRHFPRREDLCPGLVQRMLIVQK